MSINPTHIFMFCMCGIVLIGIISFLAVHIYYKRKTLKKIKEIAFIYEQYKSEVKEELKKEYIIKQELNKKENE